MNPLSWLIGGIWWERCGKDDLIIVSCVLLNQAWWCVVFCFERDQQRPIRLLACKLPLALVAYEMKRNERRDLLVDWPTPVFSQFFFVISYRSERSRMMRTMSDNDGVWCSVLLSEPLSWFLFFSSLSPSPLSFSSRHWQTWQCWDRKTGWHALTLLRYSTNHSRLLCYSGAVRFTFVDGVLLLQLLLLCSRSC